MANTTDSVDQLIEETKLGIGSRCWGGWGIRWQVTGWVTSWQVGHMPDDSHAQKTDNIFDAHIGFVFVQISAAGRIRNPGWFYCRNLKIKWTKKQKLWCEQHSGPNGQRSVCLQLSLLISLLPCSLMIYFGSLVSVNFKFSAVHWQVCGVFEWRLQWIPSA